MKQNLATQRTLKALRNDGWLVVVAERWNPYARKRQDLFGRIDLVAIKPGVGIMGVQVCTHFTVPHNLVASHYPITLNFLGDVITVSTYTLTYVLPIQTQEVI